LSSDNFVYLVHRKSAGCGKVVKANHAGNDLLKVSEYDVSDNMCSCRGFVYRRDCKHIRLLKNPVAGESICLVEARKRMPRLIRMFQHAWHNVDLPNDVYDRVDGAVVCINLNLRNPVSPSDDLPKGLWETNIDGLAVKINIA